MKKSPYSVSLAAELATVLGEEKEWHAPFPPPHPSCYVYTDNYLTHVIDSVADEVYLRCFLEQAGDHPDPDIQLYQQGCSQFASISEARNYLDQLLVIAQTFTTQPYANGYLDDNLIAGPVELIRMQRLLSVADIELSESDQALLSSGQYIKRDSFENEYLNQTMHILTARELIGSLDAYFTHLEECAFHFRDIEQLQQRIRKLPFSRFAVPHQLRAKIEACKYYTERDTGNIIHVNNRNTRLLNTLYGNEFQQGFPFFGMQLCNSDSASDLVWRYIDTITNISTLETEWRKLPLSQFSDAALMQLIKLHYKVNHLILVRRTYYDDKRPIDTMSGNPEIRLTPDEFIYHFPKLAHLKRFVSQQNCHFNPYVQKELGRPRMAIIPVLDEYYAMRSLTLFHLDC